MAPDRAYLPRVHSTQAVAVKLLWNLASGLSAKFTTRNRMLRDAANEVEALQKKEKRQEEMAELRATAGRLRLLVAGNERHRVARTEGGEDGQRTRVRGDGPVVCRLVGIKKRAHCTERRSIGMPAHVLDQKAMRYPYSQEETVARLFGQCVLRGFHCRRIARIDICDASRDNELAGVVEKASGKGRGRQEAGSGVRLQPPAFSIG